MKELLLQAAAKYGTPLYVYDLDRIRDNVTEIQTAFGSDTEIHYACKALDNLEILKEMRALGCGIDAVSQEELEIALMCGYRPVDINFTPNGAPLSEYIWAHSKGINVHIDNPGILEELGKYKAGFPVSIRFNPKIRSGGHVKLQVGAEDSKFGLYPEEMEHIHEIIARYNIEVRRIHVHVGSDVKTAEDFLACWRQAFPLAKRYQETVRVIDLGGGFGVQYFPDDPKLNMKALGKGIRELHDAYLEETGHDLKFLVEPGKSLVGNAGFFLAEVTATKHLEEHDLVYVNSGFNHLIRPMYYGARHRIENLSSTIESRKEYKVVGYLCETDTFDPGVSLPQTKRGDILCIYNAGAYAFTMSSNYNSRCRPAEVLIKDGDLKLIRRRETLEDLLATQADL